MKIIIGILLLLPGLLSAQIVQQNKIQGTWIAQISGAEIKLVLNEDGTGNFDGDKIKYKVQSGVINLTIISESETLSYNYILEGNSLTFSGGDLEENVVFTREG